MVNCLLILQSLPKAFELETMMNDIVITTLKNKLLIAMPVLQDPFFGHSVAYIFEHNKNGAMGIVINKPMDFTLGGIFDLMDIKIDNPAISEHPVLRGGPVSREQGFIIHRESDIGHGEIADKQNNIIISASKEDLIKLSTHLGDDVLISLGYAGWEHGQLEEEIQQDAWLVAPLDPKILFEVPYEKRWRAAVASLGINPDNLCPYTGHA
jgi:putative transcriptional regulator